MAMPAAPATRASVKLSMSNCAATRARPAPSATRTAISLVRPSERDKRRLPTFAQATRSTTTTAENMSTSGRRVLPTIASLSETGKYPNPGSGLGARARTIARDSHVHRRIIERHAWLEPGDGENPAGFPARRCGIRHMHRYDDAGSFRGRRKAKSRRGYTDDLPQLAPDADTATDRVGIGSEVALPELMSEDCDWRRTLARRLRSTADRAPASREATRRALRSPRAPTRSGFAISMNRLRPGAVGDEAVKSGLAGRQIDVARRSQRISR